MNVEFPEEGKFHLVLLSGNRYKVCGDPEVQGNENPHQIQCSKAREQIFSILETLSCNA